MSRPCAILSAWPEKHSISLQVKGPSFFCSSTTEDSFLSRVLAHSLSLLGLRCIAVSHICTRPSVVEVFAPVVSSSAKNIQHAAGGHRTCGGHQKGPELLQLCYHCKCTGAEGNAVLHAWVPTGLPGLRHVTSWCCHLKSAVSTRGMPGLNAKQA